MSASLPGIELRKRSIRARLTVPSPIVPAPIVPTGRLSVTCPGTFSVPVPDVPDVRDVPDIRDLASVAVCELLLFARLIGAPLADRFVTQPPHETIECRPADPEAARGFGPIALGLGQRACDSL